MIVGYLNLPSRAISPYKAQPPLIVDANTALTMTVAAQGFQTVAGRHRQIVELPGGILAKSFARARP